MKIKKKIDVEIEIELRTETHCGYFCEYLDDAEKYCKLFKKSLEIELLGSWYDALRCQQCIETFGMGEE